MVADNTLEVVHMNFTIKKGLSAHERLLSTYVNVGICDIYYRIVNLYFHILCIIKDRPRITLASLRTIFYSC